MAKVRAVIRFIARNTWRVTVSVAGFALLVAGAIMMVTPGPGLLVIIAGLAVLATQYAWAERALDAARTRAGQARDAAVRKARRESARSAQSAQSGPSGMPAGDGQGPERPPLGGPQEPDAERERS